MASIPQRFGRIALHKFHEFKRRIEDMDEDALNEIEAEQQKARASNTAKRELDDAIASGELSASSAQTAQGARTSDMPSRPRTPEQIAAGVRPNSTGYNSPANTAQSSRTASQPVVQGSDPLAYHYQLLGVENGSDFVTVQGAYNKLAARCDPARFPADSDEAKQAAGLRQRLDASFKVLREALDFTARRFDLLEFDPANAPAASQAPIVPQPSQG